MGKSRAQRHVTNMLERVKAHTGGEVVRSASGVPHLVFPLLYKEASVVFFGKTQSFRLFYPYPSSRQVKVDFKWPADVIDAMQAVEQGAA